MTDEPVWLGIARRELGVKEAPGAADHPRVLQYLNAVRLTPALHHDETPWCSAFACWVMEQAGIASPRNAAARSWLDWGERLLVPQMGCIVVLKREDPEHPHAGHVGFYVGDEGPDHLKLLGGNQRNQVCVSSYPYTRLLGLRWPVVG